MKIDVRRNVFFSFFLRCFVYFFSFFSGSSFFGIIFVMCKREGGDTFIFGGSFCGFVVNLFIKYLLSFFCG